MTVTTIKLHSEVRDRLNALAAERGCTAGSMVEKLLDSYLRRVAVERAIEQMNAMSPREREEYLAEFREWEDATIGDGLDEW